MGMGTKDCFSERLDEKDASVSNIKPIREFI